MANNVRSSSAGSTNGIEFATDELIIGGSTVQVPISKLIYGALDSTGAFVSTDAGLPVQIMSSTILTVNVTNTVTVNVTNTVVTNVTNTVVVDSELPAAGALADNTANPTAPAVAAHLMVWDSTAWDRLLGSSVDGMLVNLGANNDVTITGTVTVNSTGGVVSVSGSTVSVSGSTVSVSGSTISVSGSSVTLNGVSSDAGLPVRIMGSTTISVSGSTISVSGSSVTLNGVSSNAGLPVFIYGSTVLSVSGSTVSVSGSTISVSGSSVTLNGVSSDAGLPVRIMSSTTIAVSGTVTVSGSTLSVSGSTVSVSGSTVSVINGSTFLVQPQAYTAGGCSPYSVYATTTLISASIKATSGQYYTGLFFNNSTSTVFLRIYDSSGAPAATDDANIKIRGMIPGAQTGSTSPGGFQYPAPMGIAFSNGIGIRITGGVNDTDATALPAGGIYGNVGFK